MWRQFTVRPLIEQLTDGHRHSVSELDGKAPKVFPSTGVDAAEALQDVVIFHAGTAHAVRDRRRLHPSSTCICSCVLLSLRAHHGRDDVPSQFPADGKREADGGRRPAAK